MKVNLKSNRLTKICVALLLLVAVAAFGGRAVALVALDREVSALEERRDALAAENRALADKLAQTDDRAYIERRAKSELNMLYPGEVRCLPANTNN